MIACRLEEALRTESEMCRDVIHQQFVDPLVAITKLNIRFI